jgi:hypothetical protein
VASGHGVSKPDTGPHPSRRVDRDSIGVYGQELDAWRAANLAEKRQKKKPGNYRGYMESIGMGHQVQEGEGES